MKRMFKNLAIAFTLILVTIPSFGWGRREHSTIAYIAESHLTPKAKKAISEILEGKSIVYYASWLDDYRKQMLIEAENSKGEIKPRTIPHGIKIDENGNPILQKNRDAISVIYQSIEDLRNYKNLDDSTRLAALQCIIHLVGDMHCPAHVKYADFDQESLDKKYDQTKVVYNKKTIKMHRVWDVMMISETTSGGVYDLAYLINRSTKKEVKEIQKGSPAEWGQEIAEDSKAVWYVQEGEEITKQYFLEHREFTFSQLEKAGLRLAKVLNDLFK